MTPQRFYDLVMMPSMAVLDAIKFPIDMGHDAQLLLFAIAGQESDWTHRLQDGGPARGFWQFELGGLRAVCNYSTTKRSFTNVLSSLDIANDAALANAHAALAWCDPVALAVARMLVYTDQAALPKRGDPQGAWSCYQRLWRPGRPRPNAWDAYYATALTVVPAA